MTAINMGSRSISFREAGITPGDLRRPDQWFDDGLPDVDWPKVREVREQVREVREQVRATQYPSQAWEREQYRAEKKARLDALTERWLRSGCKDDFTAEDW